MRSQLAPLALVLVVGCGKTAVVEGGAPLAERVPVASSYFDALRGGRFADAAALHDDAMRGAMGAPKLEETWRALVTTDGEVARVDAPVVSEEAGFGIAVFPTTFASGRVVGVKVVVDGNKRVAGLWFGPAPEAAPSSMPATTEIPGITETDLPSTVRARPIVAGAAGWPLMGSLTLPATGDGPFPAVVLVHGSGPHDHDETIGPNKPFRDLAHGLAARGIAAVRYEKRTRAHAQRLASNMAFTVDAETVDDAAAAVALLAQQPEIAPDQIFVVGHSLGGMVAPRIAKKAPTVRGLIVLAGNTRRLEEAIVDQLDYLTSLEGSPMPKEQVEALRTEAKLVKALDPAKPDVEKTLLFGTPAAYWLDLKGYDPARAAAALQIPMLFLQGDRDYQVTTVDLDGWRRALDGRRDVMFRTYPALNHLFLEGDGKSRPEEYERQGTIPPYVLDDVASFIKARARAKAAK